MDVEEEVGKGIPLCTSFGRAAAAAAAAEGAWWWCKHLKCFSREIQSSQFISSSLLNLDVIVIHSKEQRRGMVSCEGRTIRLPLDELSLFLIPSSSASIQDH